MKKNVNGVWFLVLTNSERMALIDLLIEHLMSRSSTQVFVDIVSDATTKTEDLLVSADRAIWIPARVLLAFERDLQRSAAIPKTPADPRPGAADSKGVAGAGICPQKL